MSQGEDPTPDVTPPPRKRLGWLQMEIGRRKPRPDKPAAEVTPPARKRLGWLQMEIGRRKPPRADTPAEATPPPRPRRRRPQKQLRRHTPPAGESTAEVTTPPRARLHWHHLRGPAASLWRRIWIVVAITFLAAAATYAITVNQAKVYTATTRVLVNNASPTTSVSTGQIAPVTPQSMQIIAGLLTGQADTASVYKTLGGALGSAGTVRATVEPGTSFIDVTASSRSAALAASLANDYVSAFLSFQTSAVVSAADRDLASDRATLTALPRTPANLAQRDALLATIARLNTTAGSPLPGTEVVDAAVPPTSAASPKPLRDAGIAAAIGLVAALLLVLVLTLTDRRLMRVSAVERLYGRPVIAVLPHLREAGSRTDDPLLTPPEFVEVMRSLRVNLRLAVGDRTLRTVLVTSALPAEGKSTVVRDLAFAHADAGERVLVIDCDLRRPSAGHLFGVAPEVGLAQVLRREVSPAEAALTVYRTSMSPAGTASRKALAGGDPRAHGSIDLMAHGERLDSPAALLASSAMTALLAIATAQYDVVILDTAPILTITDAVPLLDQVSAVLFVARLGVTTRDVAERLTVLGERVPDMNLVGVVVNDMRGDYVDEGYNTYSEYGYAYSQSKPLPGEHSPGAYGPLAHNDALPPPPPSRHARSEPTHETVPQEAAVPGAAPSTATAAIEPSFRVEQPAPYEPPRPVEFPAPVEPPRPVEFPA
ncbi:MAG: Wzz/FepE/Etk N-terminal domain-containing protein, partial [Solirubrobacteraceae bacterium]